MAKKKYYAVKIGKNPGIYESWDECKAQTEGVSGALFQSFPSMEEAQAFLSSDLSPNSVKEEKPEDYDALVSEALNESRVVAFVDGGFSDKGGTPLAAFGCYIIPPDNDTHVEISDRVHTQRFIDSRNIGSEVFASLEALNWAVANGYKAITIFHDLDNIGKWARGEFKTNSEVSQFFVRELKSKYYPVINVKFIWVKAHAGITFNEKADKLASGALRNLRKPVGKYGNNCFTSHHVPERQVMEVIDELRNIEGVVFSQEQTPETEKRYIFKRVVEKKHEKLTVTFYPATQTTLLQGKVESLFSLFLASFTRFIPEFEMIKAYSSSYKTRIEKRQIDAIIESLNLPKGYPPSAITLLKQAALMLTLIRDKAKDEYDYTHYVQPAYRALEGHIKFLFEQAGVHIEEKSAGGNHFDKNGGIYVLKTKEAKTHPCASKLESAYNLYHANRHIASHFGEITGSIDTTFLIESRDEAGERIEEVLKEIQF